jgi:hypothetical protein
MDLCELSDDDLVTRIEAIHLDGQRLLAKLLLHLVEIENRRLELRQSYSSLFDFCRRKLGMSDSEAYRRITAARLVRRFPPIVAFIERGEIHLSILVLLKHHLTRENFDELMAETRGKSKREVEAILARRAPKPDVPSAIRELPTESPQPALGFAAADLPSLPSLPSPPPPRVEQLSGQRHLVQFTVTTQTRTKLEHARDLLRHANPSGDLGEVVDRALTLLIAKLEKEKMAKTDRPKPPSKPKKRTRHIPADVRRQVWERDGERCAYVGPNGERCTATTYLEIEHRDPFALGGEHTLENLCVLCRAHNQWFRELHFGKDFPRSKSADVTSTPPPPTAVPAIVMADTQVDAHRIPPVDRAQAVRGLAEMGFQQRDISRALDAIDQGHALEGPPSLVEVFREAIRILTS